MKIKNKLIGIIIILVAAIFIGNFNTLGGLPNSKHNYLNSYSVSNDKYLMLVNKDNPLELNYVPEDLVKPNVRFLNSTSDESKYMDKSSKEAQWLANNAYRFGFILRYPEGKEDITGYNYEPWHIRYVGKKAAKYIYNNNLTLEECLNK